MLTMNVLASVTPILLLLLLPSTQGRKKNPKPHIVLIVADDLGWSDVGFRDPAMATPVIDKLASEGVLLNFSYMMKSCTPSRSSLLTGVYAFRMGLQDKSLTAYGNNSVPLDRRFFPQDLQANGYSTHFVGKWHLGFCRREMTPTYRGFDTFYGMYNGAGDYYSHETKGGYDMQDDKGADFDVDLSANGTYSTHLFTDKAVEIIEKHDVDKPLFLFLSYQAVHGPLQVPDHYVTKYCSDVTVGGDERQKHCAMTAAMDEGIGKVMTALRDRGLNKNLITFFTSDNGGPVNHGSSNWPLRGSKITEWEGGTRVVSILHSKKYLPDAPYVWDGLIHVVDWYPTLLKAAGITMDSTTQIDGIDNWNRIVRQKSSKRNEFVYNLNDRKENYSYRLGDLKLVNFSKSQPDGWFNPPPGHGTDIIPAEDTSTFQLYNISMDPTETTNLIRNRRGETTYRDIVKKMKKKILKYQADLVPTVESKKIIDPEKDLKGVWRTNWC